MSSGGLPGAWTSLTAILAYDTILTVYSFSVITRHHGAHFDVRRLDRPAQGLAERHRPESGADRPVHAGVSVRSQVRRVAYAGDLLRRLQGQAPVGEGRRDPRPAHARRRAEHGRLSGRHRVCVKRTAAIP